MKNNKNCRILVATLVTVLSFVIMMFTFGMAYFEQVMEAGFDWHVDGLYLALVILVLVCWLTKTCTYTVTSIKNKEENYSVKLVFEILTGLGLIFTLVAFCFMGKTVSMGSHEMHLIMDFNMVGSSLAFISSLATNVLAVKK